MLASNTYHVICYCVNGRAEYLPDLVHVGFGVGYTLRQECLHGTNRDSNTREMHYTKIV